VYEPEVAHRFLQQYQESHGNIDKPVLVGILPLFGVRHANFLHNEVPGILIPDEIRQRIENAGEDGPKEGVRIAVELIEQVRGWAQGVYLMPAFSRYDLAAEILEAINSSRRN
jgi:homocysteine S-methyltransferase